MDRIGVRELRQHASRYLARVAGGETLEVTDRGRAVAHLVPIRSDAWDDLVTSGRVSPAEDAADVADEAPGNYDIAASDTLVAMRAEET
jgi:prevent-host-death family protein